MGDGAQEDDGVLVSSGCSERGRPFVNVRLHAGGETLAVQLDVDAARQIGADMIDAAASADADAILFAFVRSLHLPDGAWSAMMLHWREYRRAQAGLPPVPEE